MSLKGDKYETQEEIQFRLVNTVVMYEGKPVYITRTSFPEGVDEQKEIARVHFLPLPLAGKAVAGDRGEVRKFLSSKNFDLAPFKMGYYNHKGQAIFASRTPIRQNRQGLSQETTTLLDVKGKPVQTTTFGEMVKSQGFVDMVAGKYPTFQEVGGLLDDKENASIAVSRSFAFLIDHDLEALMLMHRGVKCGIALKGEKHMRLPPKYHFLKQEAEECRIPLA